MARAVACTVQVQCERHGAEAPKKSNPKVHELRRPGALATETDRLPPGPARAALESLLPHHAVERSGRPTGRKDIEWLWDHKLLRDFRHSGSDWRGDFQACPCEDPLCIGVAYGWRASATLRALSETL